ncbi:MAG: rhodanese-like domain-containing protein [Psychroflexus sp.]|uniref:rhodanese-like domain-containing protein n=1 Tax=Psychroflexus sp. S27 TaxID=1982757 RepID=UPI000C297310|nr:rhodanese-like domain-containing protein [Psychroflexus sp. S27]PJX22707.1 hypothetical protein CAP47_06660 [Psychroflexus sp. S27]
MSISHQKIIQELLAQKNTGEVPYISVEDLHQIKEEDFLIFDTREKDEFNVSHLPNAIHIGYENFDLESFKNEYSKNSKNILYCSLGVRSERIGIQLQKAGFESVHNLYGGIFQWADFGFPLFNSSNEITEKVHVYSSKWEKYLLKAEAVL